MNGSEKSDGSVVPMNRGNEAGRPAEDCEEGRGSAEGNSNQQNAARTQCRNEAAPNALERVRQVAVRDRKAKFTALFHHLTLDRLHQAYRRLKPRAAPGVDGVTWEQYGHDLGENLRDLYDRLRTGAYRAKPSRRAYIPKADGRQRPLGVAALEDKIVQSALVEVLEAIYETDFLGFSYGFRRGRGAHDALDALMVGICRKKVGWVLDADIRGFFDNLDHGWLVKFVEHRIGDRRVVRLIQKWLAAGVMEDGEWTRSETGTPQGATVSPLLANLYLHHVFDLWAHHWRTERGRGEVIIVRYADDFVVGFERQSDGEQFLTDLRERLRKFGLELHSEKTRLIEFGRFAAARRARRGLRRPETFSFLGFTHMCGQTKAGKFLVKRQTEAKRLRAKLHAVKADLRLRWHQSINEQGTWLRSVVRGHFAYFAVPTNSFSLGTFRTQVARHWLRVLQHRGQRDRTTWTRMTPIVNKWLPRPRISHPWPDQRFDVRTQGKSRMR
jgi:RNA-directed DNA polymerase